ncbi:MAG: hypothetical protein FJ095_21340 [Deltaproteobacteria bacterium]|nr:hypothetical protein [Deltaproteobacteria bacterium]
MQIPRLDPTPPLPVEPLTRGKTEDRSSVAEAATAAQLEPVGSRARDRGRDPTLDPTRQRRERGDLTEEERRRRPTQRPPSSPPEADAATAVSTESLQRAVDGLGSTPPPGSLDVSVRAFEMISEWGRERLQSGDLAATPTAPSTDPTSPAQALLRRAAVRAYRKG